MSTGAIKHDTEKPDLALLPAKAKIGIARALMDGERKYGRYNYLKGMDWSRLIAAADRHLTAFNDGEDIADDSQLNHLFHAGACIMMLIEYFEHKIGNDNRRPKCQPNSQNQTLETTKLPDSEILLEDNSQLSFDFSKTYEASDKQYSQSLTLKQLKK